MIFRRSHAKLFLLILTLGSLAACASRPVNGGESRLAGNLYYTPNGVVPLAGTPYSSKKTYVYFLDHSNFIWWGSSEPPEEVVARFAAISQRDPAGLPQVIANHGRYETDGNNFAGSASFPAAPPSRPYPARVTMSGSLLGDSMNITVSAQVLSPSPRTRFRFDEIWPLEQVWQNPAAASGSQSPCQPGGMLRYSIDTTAYECFYDHGFSGKDASGWPENLQYIWSRIATAEVCAGKQELTQKMLPILIARFGDGELVHELNGIGFHRMQMERNKSFCTAKRLAEADSVIPFFLKGVFPENWPADNSWTTRDPSH